jgi:hypothetical protein
LTCFLSTIVLDFVEIMGESVIAVHGMAPNGYRCCQLSRTVGGSDMTTNRTGDWDSGNRVPCSVVWTLPMRCDDLV